MAADAWFVIIGLCLTMYVLLDGYDLGIGALVLIDRDPGRRREMVDLVATAWDGNETWIILLGVALWGGLPTAYAGLLPGLYLPLIVMLFALISRGISIEMVSASVELPRRWAYAFGAGSVVAAFAQGVAFGGLLSGVRLDHGRFAGSSFDFFTPYSVLTGVTTVLVYSTAGAAVLQLKTEGELRTRSAGAGRVLAGISAACVTVCALSFEATAGPIRLDRADRAVSFAVLCVIGAGAFAVTWWGFGREPDARPIIGLVVAQIVGVIAVLVALFPTVVPPGLTVAAARAPTSSLDFLLIGVGLSIPFVLFYNWFAHHVFRGKYRDAEAAGAEGVSAVGTALRPRVAPDVRS
jgi:cytochrome d ubiquinol oxidase subunit II